ncbi:unnamed protein product [marine sediment metagenome]|uniref:Uncharacterized protein n=1 Tax=marine sediment metagenome TaxID=412755 RepID=X0UQD0_9ZZZZ
MEAEEKAVLVSSGKAKYPCKCTKRDPKDSPKPILHSYRVFSDGWTRWVCLKPGCGGVKFSRGKEVKEI